MLVAPGLRPGSWWVNCVLFTIFMHLQFTPGSTDSGPTSVVTVSYVYKLKVITPMNYMCELRHCMRALNNR